MAQERIPATVRRRLLVETALVIAERSGLAAVTARSVAAAANVSLGLVHYCFTTTADLSTKMAERMIEQLAEAALPALDELEVEGDIRTFLEVAIGALWSEIVATPQRQLLTYEMTTHAIRTPGLEAIAHRQYEVSDLAVTELLLHAARSAGVSWSVDVAELARLVVMAIDGATLRWLVDQHSDQALTSLAHVADLVAAAAEPEPARGSHSAERRNSQIRSRRGSRVSGRPR